MAEKIPPTFALIDPFGFSGIPYELIKRLLGKSKCEVLIVSASDDKTIRFWRRGRDNPWDHPWKVMHSR